MPSSPVEQRNFYLTLSVLEGQKLAHSAGFSVPSEEVQRNEISDIFQKWLVLAGIGALDATKECASWMISMLSEFNDWDDAEAENTKKIITSFGIGLLSHLIDSEILVVNEDFIGQGNIRANFKDFIGLLTFVVDTGDDEYLEDDEDE